MGTARGYLFFDRSTVSQLERTLPELLGERVWRESGLGTPTDIGQLQQRITMLEQTNVQLVRQFEERDLELDAVVPQTEN